MKQLITIFAVILMMSCSSDDNIGPPVNPGAGNGSQNSAPFIDMEESVITIPYDKTPFIGRVTFKGETNLPNGKYDAKVDYDGMNHGVGKPVLHVGRLSISAGRVYLGVDYIVNSDDYRLEQTISANITGYNKPFRVTIIFVDER